MGIFEIFFSFILGVLAIRTFFWHLQNWQLREYRTDRMKARLKTVEGRWEIFSIWVFPGIFPRPKRSFRILLICTIFLFLNTFLFFIKTPHLSGIYWFFQESRFPLFFPLLIFERLIWLTVFVSVKLSEIPVKIRTKKLFKSTKKLLKRTPPNLVKIAIGGSYGKSSTKEILVHLLTQHFGAESVLYNPANQNNEIAIARMLQKNKRFLTTRTKKKKFVIIETGAYKRGELAQVCDFFQPDVSILTAIGNQHLDLFGSQRNIQLGKFELAQGAHKTVYFNADNHLLEEIFNSSTIEATPIAVSQAKAEKIRSYENRTTFKLYGEHFVLPWPGKFFVQNALLGLECAKEQGIPAKKLAQYLHTIPSLKRALNKTTHPQQQYTLYQDLYSANAQGVLSAIQHLQKSNGRRIFVSQPLLELGSDAQTSHQQIFEALKECDAEVYWLKDDFKKLGKQIIGPNFFALNPRQNTTIQILKILKKTLEKNDHVLIEGKIPKTIKQIFTT